MHGYICRRRSDSSIQKKEFIFYLSSHRSRSYDCLCDTFIWEKFKSIPFLCASYQIRKLRVALAPWMPGTFSPPPRVSDPDMHQHTIEIQPSDIIMRSNMVRNCINNCRNWVRISNRCWIHKRHPLPNPNRRALECPLWIFMMKLAALYCARSE